MDCPRCKLPLRKVDYEGVETDMCDGCWGFWLDTGELEEVMARREWTFSRQERDAILELGAGERPDATKPIPCPCCGKLMERIVYESSIHLTIDRCPRDGVWLDTGEIKKVQAMAEKSARVQRLLIRKLGVGV
jgi:Zn-finger nucleic acid-binding protein